MHFTEHYYSWFSFDSHHFAVSFLITLLSLGFLSLTTILAALVAKFSQTYIHLEAGFARFYLLLLLATFGMNLVVLADSLSLTVVGWEFLAYLRRSSFHFSMNGAAR